ncbi:MAG: TonB-dependent receptor, partial [Acidobacteria bacterium]|nr:TonB-dependent receptor [Acidobacteriota bacterium]
PTVNMASFSGLSGGPYPSHSSGPIYDLSDSFTWVKSNHTLKTGFFFEHSGENDNDEINVQACPTCTNNQNGQFLFTDNGGNFIRPGYAVASSGAAVANAALGLFDTYSEIGQRAYTLFRSNMYEAFAQDSWKVKQNLTINYGLRYTVNVPYHALWGNMAVFDPALYNPALAVTIDPKTGLITGSPTLQQLYNGMVVPGSRFPSSAAAHVPANILSTYNFLFHGLPDHYSDIQWHDFQPRLGVAYQLTNKTVLRAGGGRFFTRLGVSDSVFLGGNPPFQPNASVSFGSVDNPGGTGANPVPLVVTTQTKNFRNPEAWNWNFTVERQFGTKSTLSVGYVGRRGIHLQREADINQPTLAAVAANPKTNLNAIRPYKGFGSVRESDNIASSRYNSLQINFNHRMTSSLQFGVAYTLSKSMDDGSNQRDVVPDTYNTSMLWGPSEFDARHILVINYLYQLPFFRQQSGFLGRVLGGWQLSGITQFQTGLPCSVAGANDYAGVGLDSNFGCGVNGQYWVMNGKPKIIGKFGPNGQWFSTTNPDGTPIFTAPTPGTFNLQRVRDIIYQPGFQNWNMGLFKAIPVSERFRLQFRAEAFNVWNHPNWCGGSGCSGTTNIGLNPTNAATFGKVLTKGGTSSGTGERNLQLSLRAEF